MTFATKQEELAVVQSLRPGSAPRPNETIGQDGYLHCKTCGERTEMVVPGFRFAPMLVRTPCGCDRAKRDAEAAQKVREQVEERRSIAFRDNRRWRFCTFESDDCGNPLLTKRVQMFVEDTATYLSTAPERRGAIPSPGLLLYGDYRRGQDIYGCSGL